MLTMQEVVSASVREIDAWRTRVAGIPYERKGILYSEMFFFCICAGTAQPKRILESGRARGQSTLLLAASFPGVPIVSIESDPKSPDAAVAEERLRACPNVDLRFGDATRLLPELVQPGDVALIDGPKGFRAVRLAMRLLYEGRVRMVFLHDLGRDTPERPFLEKHQPHTLYSDEPRFAEIAHGLDTHMAEALPQGHRWEPGGAPKGYGYTLACLQWNPSGGYVRSWAAAGLAGFWHRAGGWFGLGHGE